MYQDIINVSLNLKAIFSNAPRAFELLKIFFSKFLPPPLSWSKLVFNALFIAFIAGKISDPNFLHIDKVLNTRPCRPYLLSL